MPTSSTVTSAFPFPFSLPRGRVMLALVRRDFQVTRSYRLPFALDLVYGFINLLVYFFISRTFEGARSANLDPAPSYFAFVSVGIAITVVIGAASSGLAARIREEQLTGTLEALMAQPLTATEVALGLAGFPFLFAVVRAALYILIAGTVFGLPLGNTDWLGFVLCLTAAGVALSALGVLVGSLVLVVKRGELLAGMIPFAMGLVSGAFFPVSVLPGWLEAFGRIVPTRFAFDGLRSAVFEGNGWGTDTVALAVFAAVGLPLAILVFSRALIYGRRTGTLGQY
jgi:ABC-2 type transport system permease protein